MTDKTDSDKAQVPGSDAGTFSSHRAPSYPALPGALSTHRTRAVPCPKCGAELDAATSMNDPEGGMPEAGCVLVCFRCACLMQFTEDMSLQEMTAADLEALNPEVLLDLMRVRRGVLILQEAYLECERVWDCEQQRLEISNEMLDELAGCIADPTLSLFEVPHWPQWFEEATDADRNRAMEKLMGSRQPRLEAELDRLFKVK